MRPRTTSAFAMCVQFQVSNNRSIEHGIKALLYEMPVVRQDLENRVASHSYHGYAVHKAVALVTTLLVKTQTRQKGITGLRMNRYTPVLQDRSDRLGCRLPQVRAAVGPAVQ